MPAREKQSGEIYFERFQLGIYYKVVAIDADSGVEVTVMGPARTSIKQLEEIAVRKLRMRMERGN